MNVPGMPAQMSPWTYKQCLTPKEAVPQPQQGEQPKECRVVKKNVKGGTVSWVAECNTTEGTLVSNGRITYKGDTFEGVIQMKKGGMKVTQNLSGRWIGPCNKEHAD